MKNLLLLSVLFVLTACGGGSSDNAPGRAQVADAPASSAAPASTADAMAVPSVRAVATLQLPIEVLSDGSSLKPVIGEASLNLDASKLGNVSQLWFTCHRCGFFGAPEFEASTRPPVKIKASLRFVGGSSNAQASNVAWTDITDSTVTLADAERVQGGLNRGGLYTVRISLALDASAKARLVAGENRVQFRFNGTDGESNGFRILAVQLQDAAGVNLTTNPIKYADIGVEKAAGKTLTADATAGDTLWHSQKSLRKSNIVPRVMQAACSSCHAPEGRDLQYFNYSNNAIVQRSRFHGLTEQQGRQIAAYIRYSQRDVPHVAQAAPWNPPYQPGAGLDSKPLAEWAAGAGLQAVLSTPVQTVQALFGKPLDGKPLDISQADVDRVMDPNATMNVREIPTPIQQPDWNAWLPTIHPLDVWPAGSSPAGSFETGAQFSQSIRYDPLAQGKRIEDWLSSHRNPNGVFGDWSHLAPAERAEIQEMFLHSGWDAYGFLGGGRGDHVASSGEFGAQVGGRLLSALASPTTTASEPEAATTNAFIERATMSMLHWNVIRQWEWAQRYGLEGNQKWFIGTFDPATNTWQGRGEARGWPFMTVSVFFLAPHMLYQTDRDASGNVTREWYLAWERNNIVGSLYRTNSWYQMQMAISAGAQSDWVNYTVDWPYLTTFDMLLAEKVGTATPAHKTARLLSYLRQLQARVKSAQYVNNQIPLYVASDTRTLDNNRGRYGRAQALKDLTLINFIDRSMTDEGYKATPFSELDALQTGLHLKVVNGALNQFNTLYTGTAAANWRRCDPTNMDLGESETYAPFSYCIDKVKRPLAQPSPGVFVMNTVNGRAAPEQAMQYGLWKLAQMGADPSRIKRWGDWTTTLWP